LSATVSAPEPGLHGPLNVPGTAAATGARQRSGEEEGGGVGGVESRRAEVQWEDSV